jgi:hypothetical protein
MDRLLQLGAGGLSGMGQVRLELVRVRVQCGTTLVCLAASWGVSYDGHS